MEKGKGRRRKRLKKEKGKKVVPSSKIGKRTVKRDDLGKENGA